MGISCERCVPHFIENRYTLAGTNQEQAALSQLLMLANSEYERMRQHVASALQHFDDRQAKQILSQLRQDSNHLVVATAL